MEQIKEFLPYIVSLITAIVSGGWSYCASKRKFNHELEIAKENNAHEIEKLMEQHKVNIENLKEHHRLEIETKEKEHLYKLEIMEKEKENAILQKEKELENTAKYDAMGDAFKGVFGGITGDMMKSPQIQEELRKKIMEGFNNKK